LTDLEQQLAFFANGMLEGQQMFKRWFVGWRIGRAISLLMALWYEENVVAILQQHQRSARIAVR
jgi:hypothetical protein